MHQACPCNRSNAFATATSTKLAQALAGIALGPASVLLVGVTIEVNVCDIASLDQSPTFPRDFGHFSIAKCQVREMREMGALLKSDQKRLGRPSGLAIPMLHVTASIASSIKDTVHFNGARSRLLP